MSTTKSRGGRPPKCRHREDYLQYGPPPDELLSLAEWIHALIAQTAAQARARRGVREVREEIRAACLAIAKLLPASLTADAQGLLRNASIDPLADPPDDTLLRVVWLVRVLSADLWGTLTGLGEVSSHEARRRKEVSKELRAAAAAAAKALPADSYVEARRILAQEQRLIAAPARAPSVRPWAEVAARTDDRPVSLSVVEAG